MKTITTYLPYALCLILFFVGRMTAPNSKEISKKFKQERQRDREAISALLEKLTALNAESRTIRQQMKSDSAFFAHSLQQNKRAFTVLKRKYNEINLSRADAHLLDSLVSRLYTD